MDNSLAPRIHAMKQHSRVRLGSLFDTPLAGPSRISTHSSTLDVSHSDVEEDNQPTPRVTAKPHIGTTADTPVPENSVLRLRSVLSQIPNDTATPVARRPPSPAYEDHDSDFEPPNMTINATDASIAKESLRELFSQALKETPQKDQSRRRRNSIDVSEVEASPRIEIVQLERAKNKGKRRSMSDEEAEKVSRSEAASPTSKASLKTSAASMYDNLRHRISAVASFGRRSPTAKPNDTAPLSGSEVDMDGAAEHSGETVKTFKSFAPESSFAPPVDATSTPMRTLQMPSHIQMHSNLMEQDSEMQNAMQGMSSIAGDTTVNKTVRYPFPDRRPSAPPRPNSSENGHAIDAHSKSHTAHNLPFARRVSMDSASSRNSSLSAADFKELDMYERERAWNKPVPKSPGQNGTPEAHRHSSGASQGGPFETGYLRSRRSSSASLNSFEANSVGSRADFQERFRYIEDERQRERERMWNRHQPNLSRSTSSLSVNSPGDRQRTYSFPSRPDSAQSFTSPSRRPNSWNAMNADNSRPSTPASSISSREPHSEPRNPRVRERERNWNSNHPSWEFQPAPRSNSPLPRSPNSVPHSHRRLSNGMGSPSNASWGSARNRTVSLGAQPWRPDSPGARQKHNSVSASSSTPPRPSSQNSDDQPNGAAYASRFRWTFPKNHQPLPPLELDDSGREYAPSPPGLRSSSRLSASRPSQIPVRSPRKGGDSVKEVPKQSASPSPRAEPERKLGHRRSAADVLASTPRFIIEPVDLINAQTQDLVPTDIESGSAESDVESQVTSTPLARPSTIPEEPEHVDESFAPPSSPLSTSPPAPPAAIPKEPQRETINPTNPSTPPSSPPRQAEHTSPLLGLQTPPRRPQFAQKLEFKTPSPPHNMPDLPGPPSSDDEVERTPSKSHRSMNGNLTAIKTPRPPGAWALTPVPIQKPVVQAKEPTSSAPDLKAGQETPQHAADVTTNKTPAPPGAWQATPAPDSLRKKGILKVRFDVESNASGDTTLDEIPLVGPRSPQSKPGDSISEVFPPLLVELITEKSQKSRGNATGKENDGSTGDRPATPPSLRARSKSSGVRVLDAYGRETTEAVAPTPGPSTSRTPTEADKGKGKEVVAPASPRNRSAVRIVDAMGREVESEMSTAEDSAELPEPRTRSEALRRIRQAVSTMADEFSDSEESQAVSARNDQRLSELYRASQAARSTRQNLTESIQKHKDADAELRVKYGSLRESMQRTKLSSPAMTESSAKYSINVLNAWVLWGFLFLQIILFVYMYRASVIRAKRMFLTTYYDAFEPALFAHIPGSDSLQRAGPSPSHVSSPFSVTATLDRAGLKGLLKETWSHVITTALEWQTQLWDAWRRDARTAWPPT